jgi:undecaprenyl-diphosphatase
MYQIDVAVTYWANGFVGSYAILDSFMIAASAVGVPILVIAVAGQWWLPRRDLSKRHVLLAAGFSFLLGLALNQIILLFVHRMRPYDAGITHLLIARSADYSFPSDHATATTAIAAAFLLHGMRRNGLAFMAAALLVGVSRVYVGIHYASDVLGGAITGIVAAALVSLVYRRDTRADRLITKLF